MVENPEYFKMLARMISAAGRRAGAGDHPDLQALASLERDLHKSIVFAILRQIEAGWSWADVGYALGVTRQGAYQKYADDVRALADHWMETKKEGLS